MPFDESKTPELRAPEQNQFLAEVARYLSALEGGIDKYAELPLDLLLPVSSEFVEKLSYGDPLFRMAPKGTGSRIPQTTDREYLMDALFGAGMVSPAARGAKGAAKSALGSMGRARRAPNEGQMATDELSSILNALDQQRAQQFAKGGVVDLLAQTLLGKSKAKATKDAPDPSRRAAIGLPKDVTPKPGEVVVKEEVKKSPKKGETTTSIIEAMNVPMSRRDVLRAGAGQAVSAMAPRGALGALMKAAASPSDLMEQVGKTDLGGGIGFKTIPGAIAKAFSMGLDEKQTIDMLKRMNLADESDVMYTLPAMRNPYDVMDATEELDAPGALSILKSIISVPDDFSGKVFSPGLKDTLREVKTANPELYKELLEVARDTDMSIAENAPALTFQNRLEAAKSRAERLGEPFDEAKFRRYYGYDKDYNPSTLFDEMSDEFGGEDYYD